VPTTRPRVRRGGERRPVVSQGRAHHPSCQPADTCDHPSAPAAGGVLPGTALRARHLPRRPGCHPAWWEGPRPGEALARNMHESGRAGGVEQAGAARPLLDAEDRKETTIMAALTLDAWRERTLEQVHFAAQAAWQAVVVQGPPRLRACVAATATGDLHECLAQAPTIAAVRHRAQGPAGRGTAAPGFTTTPDLKGMLSLENLTEALHRLGVENTLCHLLQPQHVLHPHEVALFFNQTFAFLEQDRYLSDLTEERHEFLDLHPADDPLRFVKHEGTQRIFGIEIEPDGSGIVYEVDLDTRRVLRGAGWCGPCAWAA